MKKILFILIIILTITGCNQVKETSTGISLMDYNEFNSIEIDNITSIQIIKYTIDGREEKLIESKDEIFQKYDYLNSFKIGKETNITCEDNTTIYNFYQNDKKTSIEIECGNVLVTDNNRFELEK